MEYSSNPSVPSRMSPSTPGLITIFRGPSLMPTWLVPTCPYYSLTPSITTVSPLLRHSSCFKGRKGGGSNMRTWPWAGNTAGVQVRQTGRCS